MTRFDLRPILPSPKTVLEAIATPQTVIPHRRPELITGLQELHALHLAYRKAATDLATEGMPEPVLRAASTAVSRLAAAVEDTIFEIDDTIARRLASHVGTSIKAPLHTESVGAILSRLAVLWIEVDAHRDGTEHLPEAIELFELLGAYGALRDAVTSGERQLPTARRPRH